MKKRIGWINNQWGLINELSIPLNDRGLTLGDGIFETILIYDGEPKLLNEHLHRWNKSAQIIGMETPPNVDYIKPLIESGIKKLALGKNHGVVRLNWSRGSSINRGINISYDDSEKSNNNFWLEMNAYEPCFKSVSAMVSLYERRNHLSQLSKIKTFNYSQSIHVRNEAKLNGFEEGLLLSTNGDICCSSTANLLVRRNQEWLTPPLSSGCLQGIMRQQGIMKKIIKEVNIGLQPEEGDEWVLINSLSCKSIKSLNGQKLSIYNLNKEFWLSLL
tara:strand:+ start:5066 stop:5887 length:822 start_codon:yes stop_codon:yes gene_type:complete